MELTLRPETEATIERALESGRFADVDELIATAIGALEADRQSHEDWRALVSAKIDEGWDAAERGDTISSEEFETEMDAWRAKVSAQL